MTHGAYFMIRPANLTTRRCRKARRAAADDHRAKTSARGATLQRLRCVYAHLHPNAGTKRASAFGLFSKPAVESATQMGTCAAK
jgi:hypothetical protein